MIPGDARRWNAEKWNMVEASYVAPGVVFVDGTHINANTNTKKVVQKEVSVAVKRYAKELMEEVNQEETEKAEEESKEENRYSQYH